MRGSNPETLDPTQGTTMPHNPVKSIKIDFHTIDGMTPKPVPSPNDSAGGLDQERTPQPQTKLSPLEEVLFKHWATANGIGEDQHSADDNHYDFRGMYQQTGGLVHPRGAIQGAADAYNSIMQKPPIAPVPSHVPQLQSPGISYYGALQGKIDDARHYGGQDNEEPIRTLLNMLAQGGH